ncbi:hypothetical protein ACWDUL_15050 [Nocardia niigatensis]
MRILMTGAAVAAMMAAGIGSGTVAPLPLADPTEISVATDAVAPGTGATTIAASNPSGSRGCGVTVFCSDPVG